MQIDRRMMLAGSGALTIAGCAPKAPLAPAAIASSAMARLEGQAGGRLGAVVLETASGKIAGHRVDELFGMCSTFKLSLGATVLKLVEQGSLKLDEVLRYTKDDLLPVSPVTSENLPKGGMPVEALAKAAQETSDNCAANILLRRIGGPGTVTSFWRSLGDEVSRLDRYETELNLVQPGERRDTTSPKAMAQSMEEFLVGDALSVEHREKLIGWMAETATGMKRVRGGLPQNWRQGDKTGTGIHISFANKYNDVAIFWPPARPAVIVTCFYEGPSHFESIRDEDQAVLAEVGRIAAAQIVEWHGGLD